MKTNGAWWTLGAVSVLAAVGATRRRGSGAHWKVGVARRGEIGEWGDFFFDLDSSKYENLEEEKSAAGRHGEDIAQNGEEPSEGWEDFGLAWDSYDAEEVEKIHIPSIRDRKDKP